MVQFKKKIYLVNRDFQMRYTYLAVFIGLMSTIVTSVVLLFPLYQFEILRIPRFLPTPILVSMAGVALLNMGLYAFFGIVITHRIAGPMYAVVRCFRRIETGKWAGHLKIREKDDLKYLVRNFNQMVDGLVYSGRLDLADIDEIIVGCNDNAPMSTENLLKLKQYREKIAERLKDRKPIGQDEETSRH